MSAEPLSRDAIPLIRPMFYNESVVGAFNLKYLSVGLSSQLLVFSGKGVSARPP